MRYSLEIILHKIYTDMWTDGNGLGCLKRETNLVLELLAGLIPPRPVTNSYYYTTHSETETSTFNSWKTDNINELIQCMHRDDRSNKH